MNAFTPVDRHFHTAGTRSEGVILIREDTGHDLQIAARIVGRHNRRMKHFRKIIQIMVPYLPNMKNMTKMQLQSPTLTAGNCIIILRAYAPHACSTNPSRVSMWQARNSMLNYSDSITYRMVKVKLSL
jgi:hypothetical protein